MPLRAIDSAMPPLRCRRRCRLLPLIIFDAAAALRHMPLICHFAAEPFDLRFCRCRYATLRYSFTMFYCFRYYCFLFIL